MFEEVLEEYDGTFQNFKLEFLILFFLLSFLLFPLFVLCLRRLMPVSRGYEVLQAGEGVVDLCSTSLFDDRMVELALGLPCRARERSGFTSALGGSGDGSGLEF